MIIMIKIIIIMIQIIIIIKSANNKFLKNKKKINYKYQINFKNYKPKPKG